MSDYILLPTTLEAMRLRARAYASRSRRAVSNGSLNYKADKLVVDALAIAFPGCTAVERADMMGVSRDAATLAGDHMRSQTWWCDDVVAELAAMVAPRRARLALLFLTAGTRRMPRSASVSATRPALYCSGARA